VLEEKVKQQGVVREVVFRGKKIPIKNEKLRASLVA
jgi:hypothetical protein